MTPTQLADLLARQLIESKATLASANSEIERLRAEVETTTGAWSRLRALLQRCESKLDTARAALEEIAAFDDEGANARLAKSGSYTAFDEPGSVQIARKALEEIQ